ncbi:putative receptor-like protein kinase At3g47110 [Punica granatum]|uniref:non-specific serine/threonine protein kinase n=2 Tax=Punica granatum TaxID=22663 RepID=A0A218XR50_PUNGR|nr:putative receptor-like protein kinase At3g47110 [Punica granatum]OWM87433.1 hypothetical protein CDL15_Pgr022544 [Punica granatum]PKI46650.1 hypothetical protein CRG98_032992 [Punica granatum]
MRTWHLGVYCSAFCLHAALLYLYSTSTAFGLTRSSETDRQALAEFKNSITGDPLGVLSTWNGSIPICQWRGVTCGSRHRRVTVLNLRSLGLAGTISRHVGNLSFLRELHLENNSFTGEIPPEIGRLRRLELLRVFNNSISGKIPSNISLCSNLRSMSIAGNRLEGEIPLQFGSLSKLRFLTMTRNNLTGPIPSSFGNLSSLEVLSLTENAFTRIPETLGQLTRLTYLALGGNRLYGTIPNSIFNISSLTLLNIVGNQMYGSLPSDTFTNLQNIEYFGIAMNRITGTLPTSISNASTLQRLQITENKLSGRVPSLAKLNKLRYFHASYNFHGTGAAGDLDFLCALTNASNLEQVAINGNNLGGMLPQCIGNFSSTLRILLLHTNTITGSIPSGIGNLRGLETLDLGQNRILSSIPPAIGNLGKLVILFLNDNELSGSLPSSIGSLKQLTRLDLTNNKLWGQIPSSLGDCQNLISLGLSGNSLSGIIPIQVFHLGSLSIYLDLSRNQLSGSLPMEVGNLKNLGILDVSENRLSQGIPVSLSKCMRLEILNLQGNNFNGSIPSLSSLRGIEELDLSRNNLSKEIPDFLETLEFLWKLNLSYNNLDGPVPTSGVFKNLSAYSVLGNSKLCGGLPELNLPSCSNEISKKEDTSKTWKIAVSAVSRFLGICICLLVLFSCWRRKKKIEVVSPNLLENSLLKLSYQSLLKATDGFSPANRIGRGSFGSVYKALIEPDGRVVAVKVLDLENGRASNSFVAECEILRKIRHRNLVRLLTACSSIDNQGNDFKALVYDFMANGSLDGLLHQKTSESDSTNRERKNKNLNIVQRLKIAIDVASALEYLHHHCDMPIIHCDLKQSNVLLDEEMVGHIGDFGLAETLLDNSSNGTSNDKKSVGVRGTIGYAAPEYGMGSEVSTSGDVYSYGILLLELFSGMSPTDERFTGSFNLRNYVEAALPNHVMEITDPVILPEMDDELIYEKLDGRDGKSWDLRVQESLVSIFRIGVTCSVESPKDRRSIGEVVVGLHSVREKLLRDGKHRLGKGATSSVMKI